MGLINRIQNSWTKRQLFNPDTLVLRAVDGSEITVNARNNGGNATYTVPPAGTRIGAHTALATVDQTMTNTAATINYNTTVNDFGGVVSRAGGVFTILKTALYSIMAECTVFQLQNNSIFTMWAEVNGVPIPYSASVSDIGNANTTDNPIFFVFYFPMTAGDVFQFRGITSVANGARLDTVPAAGAVPEVPASRINIDAFLRPLP